MVQLMVSLNIYASETKAMIFEKGRHTNYDFYLNDIKLEVVTSFKYLGIHFFKNGNRFSDTEEICSTSFLFFAQFIFNF